MSKIYNTSVLGAFLLALIFFTSCNSPVSKEKELDIYFSVAHLLDQQMEQWVQEKASLHKTLVLDGNKEEIVVTPQNTDEWQRELSLLMEADLNKASFKDAYQVKEEKQGEETIISYEAVAPDKVRVQHMTITQNLSGILKDISISFSEKNSIYTSERKMRLEFNEAGNLVSYSIEGIQKMIFKDPIPYSLKAEIKHQ
ncbi:hypothetical protein QWY31_14790 [Cytophagales bacterium LB-30]|uniref:Lipoprotein n=1 Tax=Shiella aurantiaca TaxID=3058365 RepID=A0ABT8F9Y4_9BACT|nr:hypothetical protein [Shiella aurantiaca]MDN4166776.1 hypothetical protein [Shiella aurantiaca]